MRQAWAVSPLRVRGLWGWGVGHPLRLRRRRRVWLGAQFLCKVGQRWGRPLRVRRVWRGAQCRRVWRGGHFLCKRVRRVLCRHTLNPIP